MSDQRFASQTEAAQRAVNLLGGQTAVGRLLGVSQQSVWKWCHLWGVPARFVLRIESATNGAVTRYEMRPDVFGEAPESASA